jgi:hypothetical protein
VNLADWSATHSAALQGARNSLNELLCEYAAKSLHELAFSCRKAGTDEVHETPGQL